MSGPPLTRLPQHILITGGAGFIGSHVTDLLLSHGCSVRILDSLSSQVHRDNRVPDYLDPEAELIVGDVRNRETVERALRGIDAVIHLAAAVGVGQSMYEIVSYTETNELGTAVLLDALARRPVQRLVCASSMSIYGEGLARGGDGATVLNAANETAVHAFLAGDIGFLDIAATVERTLQTMPAGRLDSLGDVYNVDRIARETAARLATRRNWHRAPPT